MENIVVEHAKLAESVITRIPDTKSTELLIMDETDESTLFPRTLGSNSRTKTDLKNQVNMMQM